MESATAGPSDNVAAARVTMLVDSAADYVRRQLSGWGDRPLAEALRDADFTAPFALLPHPLRADVIRPDDPATGLNVAHAIPQEDMPKLPKGQGVLVGFRPPTELLAVGIANWLGRQDDPPAQRSMILEEVLESASDPHVDERDFLICGERLHLCRSAGASHEAIASAFRYQFSHPGIGVLTKRSEEAADYGRVDADEVRDWAANAVAALAWGWDGEAVVVAPIGDKLRPSELTEITSA